MSKKADKFLKCLHLVAKTDAKVLLTSPPKSGQLSRRRSPSPDDTTPSRPATICYISTSTRSPSRNSK